MNQHSPWLHNLAREQLDARIAVKREEAVAEMRTLQRSIEADLAALKTIAIRVHAKDCSLAEITALLEERRAPASKRPCMPTSNLADR